ncbi:hypothetical protein, partial [Nocardia brasiliensis]|uniref:hypothetical protein n=1 Tax=Nocardia brasiliensis TaxID=37326 RepID=UPI003D7995D4
MGGAPPPAGGGPRQRARRPARPPPTPPVSRAREWVPAAAATPAGSPITACAIRVARPVSC